VNVVSPENSESEPSYFGIKHLADVAVSIIFPIIIRSPIRFITFKNGHVSFVQYGAKQPIIKLGGVGRLCSAPRRKHSAAKLCSSLALLMTGSRAGVTVSMLTLVAAFETDGMSSTPSSLEVSAQSGSGLAIQGLSESCSCRTKP
jgi:hypothetical protein